MSIFTLKDSVVTIDPNLLPIPEFRKLWDRDKSKLKTQAYKDLAYVYFKTDFKSPYNAYPEELRTAKIKEDFIKDENWAEDADIKLAIKKYEEFQESPSMRLLRGARAGVDELAKFLKNSSPAKAGFTQGLEKIGKIVESLDKLEERVKKEQSTAERIRGGGDIKSRER